MFNPELIFQRLNQDNLELAIDIRKKVWPHNRIEDYYIDKTSDTSDNTNTAWLVYAKESPNPIGITGVCTFDPGEDGFDGWQSIWIDWFAVLPEFRRHGYGKKILLSTIEHCRRLHQSDPRVFKYVRLDTTYFEGRPAINLYDHVFAMREDYTREKDAKILIYSSPIDSSTSVERWDNHPLGVEYSKECDVV